jgi:hypothetical protein
VDQETWKAVRDLVDRPPVVDHETSDDEPVSGGRAALTWDIAAFHFSDDGW